MTAVALLRPPHGGALASELAPRLRDLGHRVVTLRPRSAVLDALLRPRKLGDDLGRVPAAVAGLMHARCDVAHAFCPADGLAAAVWSAHGGGAAVVTVAEVPRREELAGRRLRMATLRRALDGSAAVVATGPEVRDGLERWLGVRARVIPSEPVDAAAAAYAELYRALAG